MNERAHHPPESKKAHGAFTLIELLVTVAVIGVLAALLLPTLSSAKQRADSAQCGNNLRQLGIAVRLYADDNEGRLPRAGGFSENGTNAGIQLPAIQEKLFPYVSGTSNVFKCPRDKEGVFNREGSSYEWNASLNGRILFRIDNTSFGGRPTEFYLLRDQAPWHLRSRRQAVFVDGHVGVGPF